MPAERQLGIEPLPECHEAQLLEALGLAARELLVRELAVRLSSPEGERAPKERGSECRIALTHGIPPFVEQSLEAAGVERRILELERVAGAASDDACPLGQRLRSCDTYVCRTFAADAGGASPHSVSISASAERVSPRAGDERRQQPPLHRSGQRQRPLCAREFERPQNSNVHPASLHSRSLLGVRTRSHGCGYTELRPASSTLHPRRRAGAAAQREGGANVHQR